MRAQFIILAAGTVALDDESISFDVYVYGWSCLLKV
jgi:hypothetical protein